jgi:hypothetical protein
MTKFLDDPQSRAALVVRLRTLAPTSTRQWGRMTPHQAVCHLSDAFRMVMNPVPTASRSNLLGRTVVRLVALHSGLTWPHGIRTVPEVDQEIGGTPPLEFSRDEQALEVLMEQFVSRRQDTLKPHPIFGPLSTREWQRWGWLHVDHHLRQFGS